MPRLIPVRTDRRRWEPGLQPDLSLTVMYLLSIEPLVRGIDYITGDRASASSALRPVEEAMPLWAWGIIFITASALFLAGITRRKHNFIIAGSILIVATYGAFAAGVMIEIIGEGWPWDGYRRIVMYAIWAAVYGVFAWSVYLKRLARDASEHLDELGDERIEVI